MNGAAQLEQLRSALAGHYAVDRVLGRGGMATVSLDPSAPAEERASRHTTLNIAGYPLGYTDGMLIFGRRDGIVAAVAAVPVRAGPQYDAFPDGKRFVVLKPASEDQDVVVALNWLTDVRARVAAAGGRR